MTESVPLGRVLVGTMHGFSGTASGQTPKMARRNVYQLSGLYDASSVLMKNALTWDCEDDCEMRTGLSITPEPSFAQDPITGQWTAELHDATLKVWVERFQYPARRFDRRGAFEAGASDGRTLME